MEAVKRPSCEERGCIHKVVIYKEGCKYRVEPGRLVVHPEAVVSFVSLVPGSEIMFPEAVAKKKTKREPSLQSGGIWVPTPTRSTSRVRVAATLPRVARRRESSSQMPRKPSG
jgi:hypothetical protein